MTPFPALPSPPNSRGTLLSAYSLSPPGYRLESVNSANLTQNSRFSFPFPPPIFTFFLKDTAIHQLRTEAQTSSLDPSSTSNPPASPAQPAANRIWTHPHSLAATLPLPHLDTAAASRLLPCFHACLPSRQPGSSLDNVSFLRAAVNSPWLCLSIPPGCIPLSLALASSSHSFCLCHSQTPGARPCLGDTELAFSMCLEHMQIYTQWLLPSTQDSASRWPSQRRLP